MTRPGLKRLVHGVLAFGLVVTLSAVLSVAPKPALAVQPDEILQDSALEARARKISEDIRCLVCRNESIDASHADLARDLRLLVRERLVAGDSDSEVKDYLVERYGEYVLLTPRFTAANAFIWASGPALLLMGGLIGWLWLRRQGGQDRDARSVDAPLNPEEKEALDRMTHYRR
ncbi:MAG: cytochrome c-type biogenesis protein [Pseudomonadota bacterium]